MDRNPPSPPPPLPPKKVAAAAAVAAAKVVTSASSGKQQSPSKKRKYTMKATAFPSGKRKRSLTRENIIKHHMPQLMHASGCHNPNCSSANCAKIKALLIHGAKCKTRATGGCLTCCKIWAILQIHARQCRVPLHKNCPVPRCKDLRILFKQQAARRAKEKLLQELVKGCDEYIAGLADGAGIPKSDLLNAIISNAIRESLV